MGDVRLRLAFEKAFVPALAETRGRVHDELGVGGERDAAVAGQIEAMRRRPLCIGVVRADLQMNQIVFAAVMIAPSPRAFPNKRLFHQCTARPNSVRFEKLDGRVD